MRYPTLSRALGLAALALATILPSTGSAADKITFVTDFGFNGRHAYYYVAQEKGYYAAAGLEVTFVRGRGSADAIKQVAAGSADIGFADAGALVLARGNDQIPVQLVAIVYAEPPHAIYAIEGSGIGGPKDLEGRKVADTAFSAVPKMFNAYAKAANIDPGKVSWVVANSDALPGMLATGNVDAIGQYIVGEPLLRGRIAPKKLVRLAYSDVGLDYYGNGIIATEATIQQKADLVRRFVGATVKGMKDAFADPAAAGNIIHKYHKQIDPAIGAGETEAVAALAQIEGMALGKIDPARVAATVAVVSGAFDLKSPVKPEDMYVPGFVQE